MLISLSRYLSLRKQSVIQFQILILYTLGSSISVNFFKYLVKSPNKFEANTLLIFQSCLVTYQISFKCNLSDNCFKIYHVIILS